MKSKDWPTGWRWRPGCADASRGESVAKGEEERMVLVMGGVILDGGIDGNDGDLGWRI